MRYKGMKGRAWEEMRIYIVERDGKKCSTCPRTAAKGYQMQAGHYQPVGLVGSNNTLSWDELNVHCQCAYCNGMGQGEQEKMGQYISRTYGEEIRLKLVGRRYKIDPVKNWEAVRDHYKKKRLALKSEINYE